MRRTISISDGKIKKLGTGSRRGTIEGTRVPLEYHQDRGISLMRKLISQNTGEAYETGVNAFKAFCDLYHISLMQPVPEQVIFWFIAYCFEKSLATRTVKTFLAGINYWQHVQDHNSFPKKLG